VKGIRVHRFRIPDSEFRIVRMTNSRNETAPSAEVCYSEPTARKKEKIICTTKRSQEGACNQVLEIWLYESQPEPAMLPRSIHSV
jgi:hypothetical protein